MKILILSALFPPDPGETAQYSKELATRLSAAHQTSLLFYGHLPENIPGVNFVNIDKRQVLPLRIFHFTKALLCLAKSVDTIIINNAPATELPALLLSFIFPCKSLILLQSDPHYPPNFLYKLVTSSLKRRCRLYLPSLNPNLYRKPELLPFALSKSISQASWENWWQHHIKKITSL